MSCLFWSNFEKLNELEFLEYFLSAETQPNYFFLHFQSLQWGIILMLWFLHLWVNRKVNIQVFITNLALLPRQQIRFLVYVTRHLCFILIYKNPSVPFLSPPSPQTLLEVGGIFLCNNLRICGIWREVPKCFAENSWVFIDIYPQINGIKAFQWI